MASAFRRKKGKSRNRDQRQRRPHEESVLGREEHLQRVRRDPVHLAADGCVRADVAVQDGVAGSLGEEHHRERGAAGERRWHTGFEIPSREGPDREIERRSEDEEQVLLPDHRHQRPRRAERERAAHGPPLAHAEPCPGEERDPERRAGVRERRRDVHIEEQRRAEPDRERRPEAVQPEPARGEDRQDQCQEPVDRRPVGDGGDVRLREPVGRRSTGARDDVAARVEGRPQDRAADRAEVDPPSGVRRALEEGLVEAVGSRDAAIVEMLVLVLEREIAIEPERPQVGEVLDLVGRVDARGDGRQGQQEQAHQENPLAPCRASGDGASDHDYRSILPRAPHVPQVRNFTTCSRLNPACPTIGPAIDRRRRNTEPQNAPRIAVASATSCP